ncbi:phage minor head protein [Zhihengliuella halotolerans]|uniref:phage minor head protein n=1 Tax=Zhihengliuella halotolerans TaxID=370736 RepID=UPI000C8055D1|nr:phage minor head protein [Zhihengliuella halotolerans]
MAITEETLLIASDARDRLRRMSDAQVVALTSAWVDAWSELQPEFSAVLLQILSGTGDEHVTRAAMAKNKLLAGALQRARVTLDELTSQIEVIVANDLGEAVLDAAQTMTRIGASQLPPTAAQVGVVFDMPAGPALDAIVARTTEQVTSTAIPLPADVEAAMKRELIRGVAVGSNPNVTARRIVRRAEGRFNGGLARAANIARTELLDASRQGGLVAAGHNKDLLSGWTWHTQLDARTCGACLSKHGEVFPVDQFGPEGHPQCRCARLDKTKSWRELGFDIDEPEDDVVDARAWFDNLETTSQNAILGPGRAQLLRDGQLDWDQIAVKHTNPQWRDSWHMAPLKDLKGAA